MIFWSEQDELLNEPTNTGFYLNGLAHGEGRALPQAGHFTFLSVCSDMLRTVAPQICKDPPGTDRAAVHRTIEAEVLAFFRRDLSE